MYVTGMAPKYSKTSNNGPSEKQTNSVQCIDHFAPIVFTLSASEKQTPLNFVQRTLPSPKHSLTIHNYLQKWTVKLHPPINRMLVDHFHKIECHCGWIQRPGITLALSLVVLAFLTTVQQHRGPKMHLIMLNSPSTQTFPCLTRGYTKMDASIYSGSGAYKATIKRSLRYCIVMS